MTKQVNILWSKTKKNVEEVVTKYDYYNLSICNSENSQVDDKYMMKLINEFDYDNSYLKITKEDQDKRIEYINYVRFSYNKLTTLERKIIYWTYMDRENAYDDRYIANNLGFSLGYYYIKKKEALIRFAYSLGVEVENDK